MSFKDLLSRRIIKAEAEVRYPYIDWKEGYCCEDRCGANGVFYLFLSQDLYLKLDEDVTDSDVNAANKILDKINALKTN